MPPRRGSIIGFVVVTALSVVFSVKAGEHLTKILKEIPLAIGHTGLTGDFLKDAVMQPRNFAGKDLAMFYALAPVGLSLAAGLLFASYWRNRNLSFSVGALFVICFFILLPLSAVTMTYNVDKKMNIIIEVWVGSTMALTGILIMILMFIAAVPQDDPVNAGSAAMFLVLFQGVLLPASVAYVLGIDTLSTEEVLRDGWKGVTGVAFIAAALFALRTTKIKRPMKQLPRPQ
jgi:hypothetical protein